MSPDHELPILTRHRSDPAEADNPQLMMLRRLRRLQPQRPLTLNEAVSVAELQAHRLLHITGINRAPIPEAVFSALSRVDVRYSADLPVAGMVHWSNDCWLIQVRDSDHPYHQRLTIGHEFHHILCFLDEPIAPYQAFNGWNVERIEERIADYFARCVYTPKPLLQRYYTSGVQDPTALADIFQVPEPIIHLRLRELGITDPPPTPESDRRRLYRPGNSKAIVEFITRFPFRGIGATIEVEQRKES